MRKLLFLLPFIAIFSCQSQDEKQADKSISDSLEVFKNERAEKLVDSFRKESMTKVLFDTSGIDAPIKVTKAEIVKKEYSNYREIQLTYKNVSGKKIEGAKFRWYGVTAFGVPADMGGESFEKGFGQGVIDDVIGRGKTVSNKWDINSRDAKKVTKAWAYEVIFSDGSKWESHSN